MLCPKCDGNKGNWALWDGENTSGTGWFKCLTCNGTGKVDATTMVLIRNGEEMRKVRLKLKKTLRQSAAEQGLTPVELSAIENGRSYTPTQRTDTQQGDA